MIAENILEVRQKIAAAAARSGRNPKEIKLIAVTKTVEIPAMQEALGDGIIAFGENRVQELVRKFPYFQSTVEWHLIGHLQTNKVKQAVGKADLIHSLDRINLAKEISSVAQGSGVTVPVLIQVNVAGEESKYGLDPSETADFVSEVAGYQGLSVQGLMTMAPFVNNPEETRPVFRGLADLARKIAEYRTPGVEMRWLSMGMSNDFEVAVEEGANLVRIGSGIFGARM